MIVLHTIQYKAKDLYFVKHEKISCILLFTPFITTKTRYTNINDV